MTFFSYQCCQALPKFAKSDVDPVRNSKAFRFRFLALQTQSLVTEQTELLFLQHTLIHIVSN